MDVLPPKRTNIYYVRDRHTRRLQLSGKQTHALDKATEIDPIDCKIVPGLESGESTWHAASFIAGHIAFGIVCLVVCTPCLSVCLSICLCGKYNLAPGHLLNISASGGKAGRDQQQIKNNKGL